MIQRCLSHTSSIDGSLGLVLLNKKKIVCGVELEEFAALAQQIATVGCLSTDKGRVRSVSMMIPYIKMLRQKLKLAKQPKIVVDFESRQDAFLLCICSPHWGAKCPL